MKKSEIINLMWKFLEKTEYDYDLKKDCERLLTLMEEAGMKPPEAIFYLNKDNSNFPEEQNNKFHLNEWEEE